ncbi:ABC transporter permease [Asanoa siamensis]|uniref:ABC transporter n=1 Tax=Asanoa siamensis TaxID=926357 RepID=A0ABQ4CZ62_9ACTN|nr:ABC transporter permease [Asanoa siamensis]GIF76574.1 ABC transporter [Asanoa siamensis]
MTLALVHARFQLLETIRIPIALIGSAFFPAASMLFFVVPFAGDDPVAATFATAAMVTFSIMVSGLFTYGVGVADDRAQPWDGYVRTLAAGAGPRFAGRILAGMAMSLVSLIPVIAIGALFTQATVSAGGFLLGLGAVFVGALPFTLMGLAIGYALPLKAALVVCQVIFFPLAFGGGLMSSPDQAPGFIAAIAPYLPTRGAVELLWAAVGDYAIQPLSLVMLAVWTAVAGAIAVWAYRRDEGRRFR